MTAGGQVVTRWAVGSAGARRTASTCSEGMDAVNPRRAQVTALTERGSRQRPRWKTLLRLIIFPLNASCLISDFFTVVE